MTQRAPALTLRLVTDDAALLALGPAWRALVAASSASTPFQTWEWVESWWRHHRYGRLHVLVAYDRDVVVGILPLVWSRYRGTPFRQLRFMGAPLSDFQDLLAADGERERVAATFLRELATTTSEWDLADLNDLRQGGPLLEARVDGLRSEPVFHRRCPAIPLAGGVTFDAFLKTLGKNMRANVGRRRRQLEKAYRCELDTVTRADELPAAMEDLFRLHNARWQRRGARGAFGTPALRAFHHEIARRFLERGWLRLHRMRLDGETKACFYCFGFGGRVFYYLSGFDESVGKFSPGNVMMAFAVEQALREGARSFELLRGDESYKYEWKAIDQTTERLILGHASLRSRLATEAHRLERFVEHEGLKLQRRLWGRKAKPRATSAPRQASEQSPATLEPS
jgi:CelD/BcsL family acetyltransferase involved in cellulose biosynthesis